MDLRQFGVHNQFKILKQEGLREVKRCVFYQIKCEKEEKLSIRYDCCPNPCGNLNFFFTIKRKYVVDPDLGRVDNPEDTV